MMAEGKNLVTFCPEQAFKGDFGSQSQRPAKRLILAIDATDYADPHSLDPGRDLHSPSQAAGAGFACVECTIHATRRSASSPWRKGIARHDLQVDLSLTTSVCLDAKFLKTSAQCCLGVRA